MKTNKTLNFINKATGGRFGANGVFTSKEYSPLPKSLKRESKRYK